MKSEKTLIFLGTAAAIQLPSFHCTCETCNLAREGKILKRTRSGLAILGEKNVLVDIGPDIAFQLERENIRKIDAIFITHWHYDHIGGLAELGEPASIDEWDKIKLYLPEMNAWHFEKELSYLKSTFEIIPIKHCDKVVYDSINYTAIDTIHSTDSIGYIIEGNKRVAYLVDGIRPPQESMDLLKNIDCLIIEATMDELDENWMNLDIKGAIDIWKEIGSKECIMTHMSYHSWKNNKLVKGFSLEEREKILKENPGLIMATDGMKIKI